MATIRGTEVSEVLRGESAPDKIYGLGGDDRLSGREGNDSIYGDDGRDYLDGASGNDSLSGGAGFDQFLGGAGNDTFDGGSGTEGNSVNYANDFDSHSGVKVNLRTGKATDATGGSDTLINISDVFATDFNDLLIGGNRSNDDEEVFFGRDGRDTIDGGSGYDIAYYNDVTSNPGVSIVADLKAGTVRDIFGSTDRVSNVERIVASLGSDLLRGDDRANEFEPSFGTDTIDGRGGIDTVDYSNDVIYAGTTLRKQGIDGDLQRGTITDLGNRTDSVKSIENITGSALHDQLRGSDGVNQLRGDEGDDLLSGRGGNDVLEGGAGRDDLFGGAGNDRLAGGAGNDFLRGGAGGDRFVFGRLGDYNTVNDFGGADKIDVTAFDFANGAAVLARAVQHGTSVVIDLDDDTAIELAQTVLADLTAGDFLV